MENTLIKFEYTEREVERWEKNGDDFTRVIKCTLGLSKVKAELVARDGKAAWLVQCASREQCRFLWRECHQRLLLPLICFPSPVRVSIVDENGATMESLYVQRRSGQPLVSSVAEKASRVEAVSQRTTGGSARGASGVKAQIPQTGGHVSGMKRGARQVFDDGDEDEHDVSTASGPVDSSSATGKSHEHGSSSRQVESDENGGLSHTSATGVTAQPFEPTLPGKRRMMWDTRGQEGPRQTYVPLGEEARQTYVPLGEGGLFESSSPAGGFDLTGTVAQHDVYSVSSGSMSLYRRLPRHTRDFPGNEQISLSVLQHEPQQTMAIRNQSGSREIPLCLAPDPCPAFTSTQSRRVQYGFPDHGLALAEMRTRFAQHCLETSGPAFTDTQPRCVQSGLPDHEIALTDIQTRFEQRRLKGHDSTFTHAQFQSIPPGPPDPTPSFANSQSHVQQHGLPYYGPTPTTSSQTRFEQHGVLATTATKPRCSEDHAGQPRPGEPSHITSPTGGGRTSFPPGSTMGELLIDVVEKFLGPPWELPTKLGKRKRGC